VLPSLRGYATLLSPRVSQIVTILLALGGTASAQQQPPPATNAPPAANAPPTTGAPASDAQPTLPGSDDDPRALYEKGSALYALGRYGEAAPLFERAFTLKPDPALLYNAAQAYRLMGNKQRALTLYQNYFRLFGDAIPNPDEVKRQIDQLQQAITAEERAKTAPPTDVHTPGTTTLIATAPPREKKPLVKQPWFWAAVGGGAAIVVTGLAVGIALGTRGHTDPAATFGTVSGN